MPGKENAKFQKGKNIRAYTETLLLERVLIGYLQMLTGPAVVELSLPAHTLRNYMHPSLSDPSDLRRSPSCIVKVCYIERDEKYIRF
jgi:hypothetical protein